MRFDNNTDWKQYKLKQLSKIYDGTHQTPDYKNEGIKFVSVEDINDLYATSKFITNEAFTRDFKVAPKQNDILMTRIGDIGSPAIVIKDEPLAYYVSLALIKPLDNLNSLFAKYMIESINFQHELWKRTIHVAFPKKINKEEIGECLCFVPELSVQQKIGSFLSLIDKRIETQNKIIEDLKTLRKGIIDSLFASSEYEERLATFLQERKTYSEKGEGFEHVTLSKEGICAKTERYDRDFLVTTEDKNYKITKQNDICYNPANLKFGVICLNTYGDAIFSPIYVTFEVKNIDPYYLSLFLTSNRFIKKALRYQQGTVYERMAVNPEDFCKCKIPLNDNKTIQQTTKLVSLIDLKIKTEESIIQKYKTQKDYLLANLFI